MRVTITLGEFAACVSLGMRRMAMSGDTNLNAAKTYDRDFMERLDNETIGACGEMALCKSQGAFWTPSVNTFHAVADVGANVEVRTTRRSDGCLIIRDNDPPDRWYVLVTGEPPNMDIRGLIRGDRARQPQWMANPNGYRPAWFVPQEALQRLRGDR